MSEDMSPEAATADALIDYMAEHGPEYLDFFRDASTFMMGETLKGYEKWGRPELHRFTANDNGGVAISLETITLAVSGRTFFKLEAGDSSIYIDKYSSDMSMSPDFPLILDIFVGLGKAMFWGNNKDSHEEWENAYHFMSNFHIIFDAIKNGAVSESVYVSTMKKRGDDVQ